VSSPAPSGVGGSLNEEGWGFSTALLVLWDAGRMSESSSSQEMTTVVDGMGRFLKINLLRLLALRLLGLFYFILLAYLGIGFMGSPTRRLGPWKHMITTLLVDRHKLCRRHVQSPAGAKCSLYLPLFNPRNKLTGPLFSSGRRQRDKGAFCISIPRGKFHFRDKSDKVEKAPGLTACF